MSNCSPHPSHKESIIAPTSSHLSAATRAIGWKSIPHIVYNTMAAVKGERQSRVSQKEDWMSPLIPFCLWLLLRKKKKTLPNVCSVKCAKLSSSLTLFKGFAAEKGKDWEGHIIKVWIKKSKGESRSWRFIAERSGSDRCTTSGWRSVKWRRKLKWMIDPLTAVKSGVRFHYERPLWDIIEDRSGVGEAIWIIAQNVWFPASESLGASINTFIIGAICSLLGHVRTCPLVVSANEGWNW